MVAVPELVNLGNVLAAAAGGGVRLDVDSALVALVAEHGQEIGSNANGSWIRFANGVQVAWHRSTVSGVAIGTALGSVLRRNNSSDVKWTHPVAFASRPVAFAAIGQDGAVAPVEAWVGHAIAESGAESRAYVFSTASISFTGTLFWCAVGTWK